MTIPYLNALKTWWADYKKPRVKVSFRNVRSPFDGAFDFEGEPVNISFEYTAPSGLDLSRLGDMYDVKVPTRKITIEIK